MYCILSNCGASSSEVADLFADMQPAAVNCHLIQIRKIRLKKWNLKQFVDCFHGEEMLWIKIFHCQFTELKFHVWFHYKPHLVSMETQFLIKKFSKIFAIFYAKVGVPTDCFGQIFPKTKNEKKIGSRGFCCKYIYICLNKIQTIQMKRFH